MMNASFRTAFWAMCVGLTASMMQFVGIEITSGSRNHPPSFPQSSRVSIAPGTRPDPRGVRASSDISRVDLGATRTQAPRPSAKSASVPRRAPAPPTSSGAGVALGSRIETEDERPETGSVPEPPCDPESAQTVDESNPDASPQEFSTADSNAAPPAAVVQLGPQLEAESGESAEAPTEREWVPSLPVADQLTVELLPDPPPAERANSAAHIEAQLDQILERLDRIVESVGESRVTPAPIQPASARGEPEPTPAAPPPPDMQTRIYRPGNLNVKSLESLATPLMTKGVGRLAAAGAGAGPRRSDSPPELPTPSDALVICDEPAVLEKLDRLVNALDVPSARILIEATVVTVRIPAGQPAGIDFADFNAAHPAFAISPPERESTHLSPRSPGRSNGARPTTALTRGTSVKSGILRGDVQAFLQHVQRALAVRGAAAWQTTVLNKQPVELSVASGPSARPTASGGLSAGSRLTVRPTVIRDGAIQLEIGQCDGQPVLGGGAALDQQFMLRPGESVVLGGFFSDRLARKARRAPLWGQLPVVGSLFQTEVNGFEHVESILVLTPQRTEEASADSKPGSAQLTPSK